MERARADWLLSIADQSNQRGWWESCSETIPDWFEIYVSLEADAEEIWTCEAEFVPGLLQTGGYARAVRLAAHPGVDEADLARSAALRAARQRQLVHRNVSAVVNEAVLHRVVGGREVMAGQLARLAELIERGSIDCRALPFSAGAHPAMTGAFAMLRFADTDEMDLVYTENERGGMYLERPGDLTRYADVFSRAQQAALSPAEGAALMRKIAQELSGLGDVEGAVMTGHPAPVWRKSSYSSGNNGNCMEVAPTPGGMLLRDSKNRTQRPHRFGETAWQGFLAAVKQGRLG